MAEEDKKTEQPEAEPEAGQPAEPAPAAAAEDQPEEAPQEQPKEEAPAEEAAEELTVDQYAHIKPGMVIRVHQKIKEMTPKGDERERIQVFEGTVLARKGRDPRSATITVRKVSGGVGVERIFPLQMPNIAKIEVVKQYRVRRSKLYFLRNFKKKLKLRPRQEADRK